MHGLEPRYAKIAVSLTLGLMAILWAINNILNWETALGAVSYAISQENQTGYPVRMIPPINSELVALAGLIAIILTEAMAGALAVAGAGRMWSRRTADAKAFAAAKGLAILGAALAILNWFLGFLVIGGTVIMIGQADGMDGAMRGATWMATLSFLTLILISLPEAEPSAE